MRAVDCVHPAHGEMHATADTDEELEEMVRDHIREAHPEMNPDDAKQIVARNAYDT